MADARARPRKPAVSHSRWKPSAEQLEWLKKNWLGPLTNKQLAAHLNVTQPTLNRMVLRENLKLPDRQSVASMNARFPRPAGLKWKDHHRTRELESIARRERAAALRERHPLGKYAVGWWSVRRLLDLKKRWEAGELAPEIAEDFGYADASSISAKAKECGFARSDGFLKGFAKHHARRAKEMDARIRRVLFYRAEGLGQKETAEAMGLSLDVIAYTITVAKRRGMSVRPLRFLASSEQRSLVIRCYRLGVTVETIRRMLGASDKMTVFCMSGIKGRVRHRNAKRKLQHLCAPDRLLAYELAGGDPRALLMRLYRRMILTRRDEIVAIWRDYNEALATIPNLLPSEDRADEGMEVLRHPERRPAFEWRKRKRKDRRLRARNEIVNQARPECRAFS